MIGTTPCPALPVIREWLLGQSVEEAAAPLEQHLLECQRWVQAARAVPATDPLTDALRRLPDGVELSGDARVEELMRRLRALPSPTDTLHSQAALTPPSNSPRSPLPAETFDFLALPQAADELGRLGPYRVLKVLGAGGMGVVFLAEDPQLQRQVALKVMKRDVAACPDHHQRFMREARAAAALNHDHVVAIHQVGEDRGVPYLAMPLLQGESLQDRLQREKPLPVAEVLRIGREMAEGLAAAHERGLVHRDVKPGNIWLEAPHGRVKIVDFGLARDSRDDAPLTQPGAIMGTPAFMAPEQASGQQVDPRSNHFSLGCILYQMCTGRLPFQGRNTLAVLKALATEQPKSPRAINPAVSPGLADLILRLMAKRPAERPSSARQVIERLQVLERAPAARRRVPLVAALVLLALLGGTAYLFGPLVYRIATDQGEVVITTDDPDVEVIVKRGGNEITIVDGKSDRKVTLESGAYELELKGGPKGLRLKTDKFTLTRGEQKIVEVVRVLATKRNPDDTASVPKEARPVIGEVRRFTNHTDAVTSVAISRDGKLAVSGSRDKPVRLWDVAAGKELHVFQGNENSVRSVALTPDGKLVASGGWDNSVRVWETMSHKPMLCLREHPQSVSGVCFAADNRRLLSSSLDKTLRLWDGKTGKGLALFQGKMGPLEWYMITG